ncbi:hypothetical protein NPIL_67031, partial [Nephila pilipes]
STESKEITSKKFGQIVPGKPFAWQES